MCSPELTKGICCICYGTITPENRHDDYSDLHRGKCAILAGVYPDLAAELTCEAFIKQMRAAPSNRSPEWYDAYRRYGAYIDSLGPEDHYDMSGPWDVVRE